MNNAIIVTKKQGVEKTTAVEIASLVTTEHGNVIFYDPYGNKKAILKEELVRIDLKMN